MRNGCAEEEDFAGQAELWQANCERSLKGKKGQAALRELEAALLALPAKRLIEGELENEAGEVCAIGALARFKGKENPKVGDSFGDFDELQANSEEIERVTVGFAQELGVPRMVAIAVVHENDDYWHASTPEARFAKMLAWVQRQIQRTNTPSSAVQP
jgi:hypothetical protein